MKADEIFTVGQKVDVAACTKGKGFQGTIKRLHFTMGDATHGNSLSHRSPARSASARRRAACSRARRWPATWATCAAPRCNLEVVKIDLDRH
jgi:large subunit ribosomal protein L3